MIFGSDNQAGATEKVLDAISDAYRAHEDAYGDDTFTLAASRALSDTFETDVVAHFVSSGTAANMLALSAMVDPWGGILCHHQAHILLDESTGPALFTGGASMLPIPERTVRLTADQVAERLQRLPADAPHNIKPQVLSITQANECGQVYAPAEIAALSDVAHAAGLRVHMDGARFSNALAHLDVAPADATWRAGVDVLCLGASKNGAVAAEAVVFFDRSLATDFDYRLKRTGHLTSKARLYGAQFTAWLRDDHWLDLARAANQRADELRSAVDSVPGIRLAWPCQSNESFVIMERTLFSALLDNGVSMYEWYPDALPASVKLASTEVLARLVTSFATTVESIEQFQSTVRSMSVG